MTVPRRILVAGGSGFLGRALLPFLRQQGYTVTNLTRSPRHDGDVAWDAKTAGEWVTYLDGAVAVINLLGGGTIRQVDTSDRRRAVLDSRLDALCALSTALRSCASPPPVWLQAGTVAFYGNAGAHTIDERCPAGEGFTAQAARLWERSFAVSPVPAGTRKVLLRLGTVLRPEAGPLVPLARRTQLFWGGARGCGQQYVSWLHWADLDRIALWALESEAASGAYNATSPEPVTDAVFMAALRRELRRPWSPPIPEWGVRLHERLSGRKAGTGLASRRCLPKRLTEAGFSFTYPDLRTALHDLLSAPGSDTPLSR